MKFSFELVCYTGIYLGLIGIVSLIAKWIVSGIIHHFETTNISASSQWMGAVTLSVFTIGFILGSLLLVIICGITLYQFSVGNEIP